MPAGEARLAKARGHRARFGWRGEGPLLFAGGRLELREDRSDLKLPRFPGQ